ncbi:MAG: hypothetical protein DSZ05_06355 [Sulfurospirillum sp.]|nr:MAG: hypothetical protein DSZ05_06355 [Sulfurospirillum sp.]
MKIVIAFLLIFASMQLQAQMVKAAEDFKYLSERFANDYLFLLNDPKQFKYRSELRNTIKEMEEDLRIMAKETRNEDIHSILDYLSYTKDELQDLLDEGLKKENAQKVLDATSSIVEGVDSILQNLHQTLFKDELKYHIMKLSKLYMAIHLSIDPQENRTNLRNELHTVDAMLQNHNRTLYMTWHTYKRLFTTSPHYFIPHLTAIAVADLEESINRL